MSAPAFSVVVPAYNEAGVVGSALTSVQRQTRDDWEAIVVDDGSTDGTRAVAEGFAARDDRISILTKANEGLSAARNSGIERSRGRYVAFLDADDLWLPRYLERMDAALESRPDAGFAYTDAWAMAAESHRIKRRTAMAMNAPPETPPADPFAFAARLIRGNFVFVSTTVRREALDAAGPFDPALRSCEDLDMWLRILKRGFAAVRSPEIVAIKRERPTAMSENDLRMVTNLIEVYERVRDDESWPESIRELASIGASTMARWRSGLSGDSGAWSAAIGARRLLTALPRRLRPLWEFRRRPPREVNEAFPDLDDL